VTPTPDNWCPPDSLSQATGSGVNEQAKSRNPRATEGVQISSLCQMGLQPIMLTGFFRDLLVRHFQPENIQSRDLANYIWREDMTTGILIESIHRWRGDLAEKRPAILIKRNQYSNTRMTIGDQAGTDAQGNRQYVTWWTGSHTLFCIHASGASAEVLATEVQREITQSAPVILQTLGLFRLVVTDVGAISEIEEAKESFVIPVNVTWAYQELWTITQEALRLRSVGLSTLLDGVNLT
jgi:hypothetical protein